MHGGVLNDRFLSLQPSNGCCRPSPGRPGLIHPTSNCFASKNEFFALCKEERVSGPFYPSNLYGGHAGFVSLIVWLLFKSIIPLILTWLKCSSKMNLINDAGFSDHVGQACYVRQKNTKIRGSCSNISEMLQCSPRTVTDLSLSDCCSHAEPIISLL